MTQSQKPSGIVADAISKLNQLESMAGDPIYFEYMCRIVDAARNGSGHANGKSAPKTKASAKSPATPPSTPNGLTNEVLKRCKTMRTNLTITGMVDAMLADNYKFASNTPKVAVGDVFRRYNKKKLKITQEGKGINPHVYAWID